jgi:hypothetical protein
VTAAMWWTQLTPRERLIVTGATTVLAAVILSARAVPLWNDWATAESVRSAVLSDSIVSMRAQLSRETVHKDGIAQAQLESELSHTAVLAARSDEDASHALLRLLSAAADDVGVTLSSVQRQSEVAGPKGASETARARFSSVSVKVIGVAHPDLVPEFLAFIDTSRVQLSATSVSISAGAHRENGKETSVQLDLVVAALVTISGPHFPRGRK